MNINKAGKQLVVEKGRAAPFRLISVSEVTNQYQRGLSEDLLDVDFEVLIVA
jgi:hypothetical protein